MTFHHVGFVGDVLAMELLAADGANASHLFAGVGSQLLVYEVPSGSLLQSCTVLPDAARVHGICLAPLSPGLLAIAVHGDHYAKVLTLSVRDQKLVEIAASPRLHRWTMAAKLLPLPPARLPPGLTRRGAPVANAQQPTAALAVGLSDNSVLLYAVACDTRNCVQELAPLLHMRCVNAPLLYSMDLRWHVASGSGGTGGACSGIGGAGSTGGGLGGTSGGTTGSGGSGLRRRGGVSATDGTDSSGGAGAGDSGSSGTSGGLLRRGGVSGGGGGGVKGRGSSGGGDRGTAALWVAAGTAFLDVLTWSGPALSLDALRAAVSRGRQAGPPAASSLPNGGGWDAQPLTPIQLPQPDGSVQLTAERLPPEPDGSADAAELAQLSAGAAAGHPAALTRPVAQVLLGHVGSIHRVAWSADGSVLASASDDRTVRLWAAGPLAAAAAAHPAAGTAAATSRAAPAADGGAPAAAAARSPPGCRQRNAEAAGGSAAAQPLAVLHGHAARLWDVDLAGGVVATGSEDRTVRLWRLSDGTQLAELHGHGGRGVWRVRICGGLVASAGADASVKLWPLADWLPAGALQPLASGRQQEHRRWTSGNGSGQIITGSGGGGGGANNRLPATPSSRGSIDVSGSKVGSGGSKIGQMPAAIDGGTSGGGGGGGDDGGLVASDLPVTPATPVGTGGTRHRNSKSEFVRCICLAGPDTLFVGTNHGSVHRARLPSGNGADLAWESELYISGDRAAVLSITAFPGASAGNSPAPSAALSSIRRQGGGTARSSGDDSGGGCHSVLFSDARGGSFHMVLPTGAAGDAVVVPWQPHAGRLVQGLFWSPTLGRSRFFTADSAGELHLWAAPAGREAPLLLAAAQSPFQRRSSPRVISLAADPGAGLVVCGDSQGDVFAFALPAQLLSTTGGATKDVPHLQYVAAFPCIHSNAPVGCCAIHSGGRVTSGGRDGSVQQYQCRPLPPPKRQPAGGPPWGSRQRRLQASEQALAASCVQRLPGISTPVVDVELAPACGGAAERLVAGWQAADFVIASLSAGAELRRFCCGSLHRPFALHLAPGAAYTFVFHKGDQLHVHRRQQSGGMPSVPRVLHLLHHGMEIGAVALLLDHRDPASGCVITGAEDGSLFLAHFNAAVSSQGVTSSVRMGEQALGTAVKALASAALAGLPGAHLVVSGGAKEVLSAWLLQPQQGRDGGADKGGGAAVGGGHGAVRWQHRWLATRPPPTGGLRRKSTPRGVNAAASDHRTLALTVLSAAAGASPTGDDATAFVATAGSDGAIRLLQLQVRQQMWRPLAELRHHTCPAISLSHLAWDTHPGADGSSHSNPPGAAGAAAPAAAARGPDAHPGAYRGGRPGPTATQAAAAQVSDGHPAAAAAALQGGTRHLLFSGGTDGGIAAWDITPAVQAVTSSTNAGESAACSSGFDGRGGGSGSGHGGDDRSGSQSNGGGCSSTSTPDAAQQTAPMQLAPLAVLQGAHQSGVNGLAAAWLSSADGQPQLPLQNGTSAHALAAAGSLAADATPADGSGGGKQSGSVGGGGSGDTDGICRGGGTGGICHGGGSASARTAVLVCGGDDQSLAATAVRLSWPATCPPPWRLPASHDAAGSEGSSAASLAGSEQHGSAMPGSAVACSSGGATAAFGAVERVHNAHASALRAVWTDGDTAFTTGLDQRVRCWRISQQADGASGQHVALRSAQQSEDSSAAGSASTAVAAATDEVAVAASAEHAVSDAVEVPHVGIAEQAAEVTQVLEPSCLVAAPPTVENGSYVMAVAGRGLQLLDFTKR